MIDRMLWKIEFKSFFADGSKLENTLFDLGVEAVSYFPNDSEDCYQLMPGEKPNWNTCMVNVVVSDKLLNKILFWVQIGKLYDISLADMNISQLPNQDWRLAWTKYWQPMRFGDLLVTTKEYSSTIIRPTDKPIYLNPGLAFGSGTHETTGLCLHWLEQQNLRQKSVLDYGCGSGILAVAAVAIGSKEVVAYDHDPLSVVSARNNVQLNFMERSVTVVSELKTTLEPQFDIVVANLLLIPLLELVQSLYHLVKRNGRLIVSGILDEQKDVLLERYREYFYLRSCVNNGSWLLLAFSKRNR